MNELVVEQFMGMKEPSFCADWLQNPKEIRQKILQLEQILKQFPEMELETKHHFSKGVYARELIIPKGTLIVAKLHRHQNLNICIKGDISVITEQDGLKRIKAPATIVSPPGVKRVAFTHEDSIWMTIHGTDETDLDKIEEIFIAKSYEELEAIDHQETKALKE